MVGLFYPPLFSHGFKRIFHTNNYILQWKPLNVITLGQIKTDNINRMITISELTTYLHQAKTIDLGHIYLGKFDHINQGWPTFLAREPNSRTKKFRGPKSGSNSPSEGQIFSLVKANCKLLYTNFLCLVDLISPRGPFQNPRRAKNGPRAPRWPPLT